MKPRKQMEAVSNALHALFERTYINGELKDAAQQHPRREEGVLRSKVCINTSEFGRLEVDVPFEDNMGVIPASNHAIRVLYDAINKHISWDPAVLDN